MIGIVQAVLRESADGGRIAEYLSTEIGWEAPMRQEFSEIRWLVAQEAGSIRSRAVDRLERLNRDYRTRHPREDLPVLLDTSTELLARRGWQANEPPPLLGCTPADSDAIGGFLFELMSALAPKVRRRPYSLATKWLHFLFPESFPIYDAQAAGSIYQWSRTEPELTVAERGLFHPDRVMDAAGTGYRGIVEFYRRFWNAAGAGGLQEELRDVAARLSQRLATHPGCGAARVSVLDLVDKLIWRANGDGTVLGITGSALELGPAIAASMARVGQPDQVTPVAELPAGVRHFVDDDSGYRAWLRANAAGYVVNTYRRPSARYLVLHRATCPSMQVYTEGGTMKGIEYSKLCAGTRRVLERYLVDAFTKMPSRSCHCLRS
jgi:hypothetical protein